MRRRWGSRRADLLAEQRLFPATAGPWWAQRGSTVFVYVRGKAERAKAVGRSCLCAAQVLGSLPVSSASCRPFA
jgi:hypothetical protein